MKGEKAIPGILTQEEEKLFDAVRRWCVLDAQKKIAKKAIEEAEEELILILSAMGRRSYHGLGCLIEIEEKQKIKITGHPTKPKANS